MKSKILALGLLTLSLCGVSTKAHAFAVEAYAQVSGTSVAAEVRNNFASPMTCRVQVIGMRNDGYVQYAWVTLTIGAGGYEYAYVNSFYPFFFINGRANADCVFTSAW